MRNHGGGDRDLQDQQDSRWLCPADGDAGVGTLGLNPNRCKNPSLIIIADKIQLYPAELYERGLEIVTWRRPGPSQRAQSGNQVLNYLNNIG